MKLLRQSIYAKSFPLLMSGAILFWIANKALFTHSHTTPRGEVITHSHPFQKPESQQPAAPFHSHSPAYLDVSTTFHILFPILFLAICVKLFPVEHHHQKAYNFIYKTAVTHHFLCRGPPLDA